MFHEQRGENNTCAGQMGRVVPPSGRRENRYFKTDLCSKAGEYVDQRISTEQVDTPPEGIADTRLSPAEGLGCRFPVTRLLYQRRPNSLTNTPVATIAAARL